MMSLAAVGARSTLNTIITLNDHRQADRQAGVAAPGIEQTKAIAEEGFIYGLPIG
jgi:hypothetical protein